MTSYQENYEKAKAMLNPAQRKAVETLYGPVLAIAGPGTGKTQVLALRIAEILKETDTAPYQILALTFTEAGVIAMRNRLRSLIGPEANSVKISTFHGFCAEVISRFPEKFLFHKNLDTADDLSKIQLLKNILESGKYTHLTPFTAPNLFLKDILMKISQLKREGIDPDEFRKISQKERAEFDDIPEEEKVNPKTQKWKGKFTTQLKKIEKWQELSEIFEKYQKALRGNGLMDFDDQILFVIDAFRNDADLLQTLREDFLFVLGDEFQDSNGAQMEILEMLTEDDSPNIFVVGDDDQSIYRFQGANLENITRFLEKHPNAVRIPLTENYRSTQQILDLAESSIINSTERLTSFLPDLEKHLTSGINKTGKKPVCYEFSTADAEQYFLLQKISELRATIPLSEIAILVRTNREGRELLHYFEQNDLPAVFAAKSNVLHDIRVRQLLTLLKLIHNPYDNALFFEVLHYSVFGLSSSDIWSVWREVKKERMNFLEYFSVEDVSAEVDPESLDADQASLFAENLTPELTRGLSSPTRQKIQEICQKVHQWNSDFRNLSFAEGFQKVLTESGFLDFLLHEKTRLETLNHVNALFSEIKNLSRGNPDFSLQSFLEILELREEFDLPIEDRMLQSPEEAVKILTTHGAKGLEYEAVFVINLVNGSWGDRRNMDKIPLPEGILSLPYSPEHANEEERRLFFVAITRAKQHLFLSGSQASLSGRKSSPSRFLDELNADFYEEKETSEYEEAVFDRMKADLMYSPQRGVMEDALIREMVSADTFALSPTAFENYRVCPRKFFYENLLRIPRAKERSAALGTAVHKALEVFFIEYANTKQEPGLPLLISVFKTHLREKEILTAEDYEASEREGEEILKQYYYFYHGTFSFPLRTELDFSSHRVHLNGKVPITGKIDKVELLDEASKRVRIVDYKTAKAKSENVIRGTTASQKDDIFAGSMWRQLQFYYLLASQSTQFPWNAEQFSLDFVRPEADGKFIRREFEITEADTLELQDEILSVWDEIQSLTFLDPDLPCEHSRKNRGACEWCEMFRRE